MNANDRDQRIDELLAEYLRQVDRGVADREAFLAAHPREAETLRALLQTEDTVLRLAGPPEAGEPAAGQRGTDQDKNLADGDPLAATQPLPVAGSSPAEAGDDKAAEELQADLSDENLSPQSAALLPFGNYELLELLGRGGMGVVYRARQKGLEREVALKMILNAHLASEEEIQRFYTEARAAANIRHPHVVGIHEIGELDGQHYFSMQLIDGADLAEMIREGRLESRRAARLLRDAARAVHAAHEQGVLHRDIKPANILVDDSDHVVVTDFGLAKEISAETHLTDTGLAMGTPSYMSPEQAAGKREEMGPASDVYSLGAVLFAMLTGRPPHRADTVMDTLIAVIHEPASHPAKLNADADPLLCRICLKCLEKDPKKRYATADELAEDLDRYLTGGAVEAQARSSGSLLYWISQIPIVAAVRGRPSHRPTAGQLRAQAAIILALLVLAVVAVTLPRVRQAVANRLPGRIQVAGGTAGGAFDAFAQELAVTLSRRTAAEATSVNTLGSGDNRRMLLSGEAHLALLQEAMLGSDEIAVVAPLFEEVVYVVVRRERVADWGGLGDAALAVGPRGSGMAAAAAKLLSDLPEVDARHVDFRRLQDDSSLDGAVITISSTSESLQRLLDRDDMMLVSLPEETIERISADPQFRPYRLSHRGETIRTVATPAFLACRRDASEQLVLATLECLYPPDAADDLRRASHWLFMPMHPVARRFFQERAAP